MCIYDIKVLTSEDTEFSLSELKGKVMLIVNTATHCGFTPHYDDLKDLHNKYHDKGLEILDFPCNQFGEQAKGTNEEIQEFCVLNFNTPYKLFAKIDVNGENQTPLFKFLKEQKGFEGFNNPEHRLNDLLDTKLREKDPNFDKNPDIKWNFTKFLVDREGKVVARFEPVVPMAEIESAILKLL